MFELIPYNLVLSVHIFAFIFNITLVVIADALGLWWVLGKREVLNATVMKWLHSLIWFGLSLSILTGATLFWEARDYLLSVPAFYTKLLFVVALVVNSFFIYRHLHIVSERSYNSLNVNEKTPLFISGGISTICWVGVVVAAQFLGL